MSRSVTIVAVGAKHDAALESAISDYQKRLKHDLPLDWQILSPSPLKGAEGKARESASIASTLRDDDYVILLDERGTELSSETFSTKLFDAMASSRDRIVFIIGGAYGVDETISKRANFCWSLSPLVFPHQLVRLILAEQLYRAVMIHNRHPYHHR